MNPVEKYEPRVDSLNSVLSEREAQEARWGEQNHDPHSYLSILVEEVGEFAKEANELKFGQGPNACRTRDSIVMARMRVEAVQVSAVALAIVECLDREKWAWPTPVGEDSAGRIRRLHSELEKTIALRMDDAERSDKYFHHVQEINELQAEEIKRLMSRRDTTELEAALDKVAELQAELTKARANIAAYQENPMEGQ